MDEQTAEHLAAIVGGESWQSGGGIYLVTVNRDDGSLVVFSGDAIAEYETALRIRPEYADAHNNLAIVLAMDGRKQDAIGHWQQALHWNPSWPTRITTWLMPFPRQG